jgi:hypothetical protein
MIIAQSDAILADLRTYDQLRIDSQNGTRFRTRTDQLQSIVSKINAVLQAYDLMNKYKIFDLPLQTASLLDLIQKCEKEFQEDDAWIQRDNVFEELQRKVDAWNKQSQTLLNQAWSGYIEGLLPAIPGELLDVLGKMSAFQNVVLSIRRMLEEIRHKKNQLPILQHDIDEIIGKAQAIHNNWKEMGTDDVPPAVLMFLRAAGGRGAGLVAFTPEIGTWLEEHKMSHFFSIRLTTW